MASLSLADRRAAVIKRTSVSSNVGSDKFSTGEGIAFAHTYTSGILVKQADGRVVVSKEAVSGMQTLLDQDTNLPWDEDGAGDTAFNDRWLKSDESNFYNKCNKGTFTIKLKENTYDYLVPIVTFKLLDRLHVSDEALAIGIGSATAKSKYTRVVLGGWKSGEAFDEVNAKTYDAVSQQNGVFIFPCLGKGTSSHKSTGLFEELTCDIPELFDIVTEIKKQVLGLKLTMSGNIQVIDMELAQMHLSFPSRQTHYLDHLDSIPGDTQQGNDFPPGCASWVAVVNFGAGWRSIHVTGATEDARLDQFGGAHFFPGGKLYHRTSRCNALQVTAQFFFKPILKHPPPPKPTTVGKLSPSDSDPDDNMALSARLAAGRPPAKRSSAQITMGMGSAAAEAIGTASEELWSAKERGAPVNKAQRPDTGAPDTGAPDTDAGVEADSDTKHEEDATTHAGGDQGGEEAKAADPAEAAAADTPMPAASADDDIPADASPDGPTTTPPS